MTETGLDAAVKTRVPQTVKDAFEKLARQRGLKSADLQREALTEYLAKHDKPEAQPELALTGGNGK